jgi:hypothetical protein
MTETVARSATAAFTETSPQRERDGTRVALVYDSFRHPRPAGLRTAGASPRQLLYKAGRYTIKVQVEAAEAADRLCIVGQILDEHDPAAILRDIRERDDRSQDARPNAHERNGRVLPRAACHREAPAFGRRPRDRHLHHRVPAPFGDAAAGRGRKGERRIGSREEGAALMP